MNDHYNMSNVAITGVVDSHGDYAVLPVNPDCKICKYKDAGPFSEHCLDCGDELKNFVLLNDLEEKR